MHVKVSMIENNQIEYLQVIKKSRDVQKLSKQAIFSLHRGDMEQASSRLDGARKAARDLEPLITESPTLRSGSYSNACEEYAEAVIFSIFLTENRLATPEEIDLANTEEYLGGLLDFTGELNRVAIARATARDVDSVQLARDTVEALQGQFLRLDLRNGSIRKKYDGLKYTMKKLENTLYELSLISNGLVSKPEDVPDLDVPDQTPADA
jgi:predicted translin family RNA/ssDNA-binding protein